MLEQDAQAAASQHGQDARATPKDPTTINIRQGAYLPHWTREGATYSVNFRLFDSLPQDVLEGWVEERDRLMKKAEKLSRPLGAKEQERLRHLFSEKVEQYLDAGHGECWLRRDKIAQLVTDALKEFAGERYRLISWCIMPNHVHVIVEPLAGNDLSGILHSWKSYTSKEANKLLGRTGPFWQVEYFDHLVRDEEDFQHCLEYVWTNPEKAGLQNWKWRGITDEACPVWHGRPGRESYNA
jgi:REP element-mobilizing transposase RayT